MSWAVPVALQHWSHSKLRSFHVSLPRKRVSGVRAVGLNRADLLLRGWTLAEWQSGCSAGSLSVGVQVSTGVNVK